jgi:phosphopentomutase
MKYKRIFLIVLDSLGVGEALDADDFHDKGSNTLGHVQDNTNLFIPNLKKMGLLNTLVMNNSEAEAYYTIARPRNKGKDCLTAHYELMGIAPTIGLDVFDYGPFPRNLLERIASTLQKPIIGNIVSDATSAIEKLYKRQLETKSLIIYTTGDSNLEVAAEETIIPLNDLYEYCEKIRKITEQEGWRVSTVTARPYIVKNNTVIFSDDQRRFTLSPTNKSVLESLKEANLQTISIGKVSDIFNGVGIAKTIKSMSNVEGINKLLDIMDKNFEGLCFANLCDFDTFGGHARNIDKYKEALEEFDVQVPLILNKLEVDDLLIITADHGCDPTMEHFNHTRENVPVLIYSRSMLESGQLNILDTLGDIGATIADNFNVEKPWLGTSFLDKLK